MPAEMPSAEVTHVLKLSPADESLVAARNNYYITAIKRIVGDEIKVLGAHDDRIDLHIPHMTRDLRGKVFEETGLEIFSPEEAEVRVEEQRAQVLKRAKIQRSWMDEPLPEYQDPPMPTGDEWKRKGLRRPLRNDPL